MAIIKCPECGHQISDKAPSCPSCGVEIAGKITRCPDCGKVYFKEEDLCPHCHRPTNPNRPMPHMAEKTTEERQEARPLSPFSPQISTQTGSAAPQYHTRQEQPENSSTADHPQPMQPENKKNKKTALIVSFVLALLICGVCFYMYRQAQDNREQEEYEIAMKSSEPLVLQGYLDTFKDAPQEHPDSIMAHLAALKQNDIDWTNALVSNSKAALIDYINSHPDSPHRKEALNKIDSLDWEQSANLNTVEAYTAYLTEHPDGNYFNEAEEALKKIKAKEVSDDEKTMVSSTMRNFFQSINARDENGLTSLVADQLTLLDKIDATKSDVVDLMNKLHKDGVTHMNWKLPTNYDIRKREVGDAHYEYSISFPASQVVEYENSEKNTTNQFRINAKIGPDGKISMLKLVKIIE